MIRERGGVFGTVVSMSKQVILSSLAPFRLKPSFSPRIWGRRGLAPWYPDADASEAIGEAWLTGPESVVETGPLAGSTLQQAVGAHALELVGDAGATEFPLLVKILFPEEKLSVQVHPDDVFAQELGAPRGKTECWYILEAQPGASVALGLKPGVGAEEIRAGVAAQTLESLLEWVPVKAGEMVFVDAGTIHAIGPGLVILEIQQTSDITYRLYDYGRSRELHVEAALHVTKTKTAAGKIAPVAGDGFERLIAQRYFVADRFDLKAGERRAMVQPAVAPQCLTVIAGKGRLVAADSEIELRAGQAVIVPADCNEVTVVAEGALSLVRCYPPA
jgi:mannose-6-phosphate isomerase